MSEQALRRLIFALVSGVCSVILLFAVGARLACGDMTNLNLVDLLMLSAGAFALPFISQLITAGLLTVHRKKGQCNKGCGV